MRNSTHIVVPLGVSETKQGLLQDRYSPGRDAALDVDHLDSGGWTPRTKACGARHKAEAGMTGAEASSTCVDRPVLALGVTPGDRAYPRSCARCSGRGFIG